MKIEKEKLYGLFEALTESDSEGRSLRRLGIFEGYIPDIVSHLVDKCVYRLYLKPLDITKVDKPMNVDGSVNVDIDYFRKNIFIEKNIDSYEQLKDLIKEYKSIFEDFNVEVDPYKSCRSYITLKYKKKGKDKSKMKKEALTDTDYKKIYGIFEVLTERGNFSAELKSLGIYRGYIHNIAFKLANMIEDHALYFRKVNIIDVSDVPIYDVEGSVVKLVDHTITTSEASEIVRILKNVEFVEDCTVEEYNGCIKLTNANYEDKIRKPEVYPDSVGAVLTKLSEEDRKTLLDAGDLLKYKKYFL